MKKEKFLNDIIYKRERERYLLELINQKLSNFRSNHFTEQKNNEKHRQEAA